MSKNRKPVKAKGNNGSLNNFLTLKRVKELEERLEKVIKDKKKWKARAKKERQNNLKNTNENSEIRNLLHENEILRARIAHLERERNPIYTYPKDKTVWTTGKYKKNPVIYDENIAYKSDPDSVKTAYEAIREFSKIYDLNKE